QQQNLAVQVRSQQSTAHGMNNVLGEVLQIQQLFALFFKFQALAAKGISKEAGQVSNREKPEKVHYQPSAQTFGAWGACVGMGNPLGIREGGHQTEEHKAGGSDQKRDFAGEQDTGNDNY